MSTVFSHLLNQMHDSQKPHLNGCLNHCLLFEAVFRGMQREHMAMRTRAVLPTKQSPGIRRLEIIDKASSKPQLMACAGTTEDACSAQGRMCSMVRRAGVHGACGCARLVHEWCMRGFGRLPTACGRPTGNMCSMVRGAWCVRAWCAHVGVRVGVVHACWASAHGL
jgi:hypothetical protein